MSLMGRLPHSLLLVGAQGIGKGRFAMALAARLLCEQPTKDGACGACEACRWFAGGNHPDFRHVIPEADAEAPEAESSTEKKKASRQILIDQIRLLEDFVFVGAHRNAARVVLVEPAEAMNVAAQNSLLKILEEPPASVYFILTSNRWRKLLPTIRSRCRVLALSRPDVAAAKRWLDISGYKDTHQLLPMLGNAPLLLAEELDRGHGKAFGDLLSSFAAPGRDSLALATRWQSALAARNEEGVSMDAFVQLLQRWLFELSMVKSGGRCRLGKEEGASIAKIAAGAASGALIRCYNDLMKCRALASHPLNPQLFLEDIAERYLRALASERP